MPKLLRHKDRDTNDKIARDFLFQDGTSIDDFYIWKSSPDNENGCVFYCSPEGDSWMLKLDDLMEAICTEFLERNNVSVFTTTEEMDDYEKKRREKWKKDS
jgi:hypothetical protein